VRAVCASSAGAVALCAPFVAEPLMKKKTATAERDQRGVILQLGNVSHEHRFVPIA